jgi:hemerythrin-like domain-containing protein
VGRWPISVDFTIVGSSIQGKTISASVHPSVLFGKLDLQIVTRMQDGEKVKPVHEMADEMVAVHNMLLRGINAIYLQCINVEASKDPADVPGFVTYARLWGELVHHHHAGEEKLIFPDIARITGDKDVMAHNIEQHRAFHKGLDEMNDYLGTIERKEQPYSGQKLKAIIDSFMPVLTEHLHDEIKTLLALEKYEDKTDWHKWYKETQAQILKDTQTPEIKYTALPLGASSHDKHFENDVYVDFPGLPWFVLLLLKWVWGNKHAASWKFAPCTLGMERKELPFA